MTKKPRKPLCVKRKKKAEPPEISPWRPIEQFMQKRHEHYVFFYPRKEYMMLKFAARVATQYYISNPPTHFMVLPPLPTDFPSKKDSE